MVSAFTVTLVSFVELLLWSLLLVFFSLLWLLFHRSLFWSCLSNITQTQKSGYRGLLSYFHWVKISRTKECPCENGFYISEHMLWKFPVHAYFSDQTWPQGQVLWLPLEPGKKLLTCPRNRAVDLAWLSTWALFKTRLWDTQRIFKDHMK